MPGFKIYEILEATGGELISGIPEAEVSGINTDSRKVSRNELFLALKGEKFDGHDFIDKAISAGAGALVIEREIIPKPGLPVIKVENTLKALGDIARYHREKFQIPVIGVTGSNGKTTTKEMIAAVLGTRYNVLKSELNFNNEVGLPLTLLKIDSSTEVVVLEMGMRGEGQIKYLAGVAKPEIGVVTNVGVTHIELLGSQEGIARAKGELITSLPTNGVAVLNGDDPLVAAMQDIFPGRTVFFGLKNENLHIKAVKIHQRPEGQTVHITGRWGDFSVELPFYGRHNVMNFLAAAATGLLLDVPSEGIAAGALNLQSIEKRLRILKTCEITVIDDTYNASPPAVKAALEVLSDVSETGRKIVVLGDMLELGPISGQAHREIGEEIVKAKCSALFAYGPLSADTVNTAKEGGIDARHYREKYKLIKELLEYLSPGDTVLVKGSRGLKMEEVIQDLTKGGQIQ